MKIWKSRSESTTVDLAKLVQERLNKQAEIRPLPAAVTQLMAELQNPDCRSASLAKIIECDPALAVRLLKMANSPLYGLSREVRSIAHATSILGTRALKTLAMSAAGASMFASGSSLATQRKGLWEHSLGAAAVARVLAESEPKASPDDAFLASVFHDVGKLLLFDVIPEAYVELSKTYVGDELVEHEQQLLQVTHADIGLKSAHAWNLPENLKVAIGFHHDPAKAPAHFELTAIVHLANKLARAWGIGSQLGPEGESESSDNILQQLDHDSDFLGKVRERAEAAFADSQTICA